MVYDCYHQTYEGFDKEKLLQLVKELHNPIILSAQSFPLVKEITKNGEAVLSQDFVEQYKEFVKTMEERKPDLTKLPLRKPKYKRENIVALSNVPRKVINALMQTEVPEVYVYGYDVACPKELEERMDAFWEERLYQGMEPEERDKLKQSMESKVENRAIKYMLQKEENERSDLRNIKNMTPEVYSETQKEALQRLDRKRIQELIMNKETVKVLQNRKIDKRISQELER